jgi:hypothetical protein
MDILEQKETEETEKQGGRSEATPAAETLSYDHEPFYARMQGDPPAGGCACRTMETV